MSAVFLHSVETLGLLERSDQGHTLATTSWSTLKTAARPLCPTTLVLVECANAAARKPYLTKIAIMRRELLAHLSLISPTESDLETASAAHELGEAGQAGIVDHVSFVVMRRLALTEAFTNDAHFRAARFTTLF